MIPQLGSATVIQADARHLPLDDNSVDLIVTSPPYFALRSYTDGGEHYAGQIGAEPTPGEFVDALLDVTRECVRVVKPTGSIWVNLGDKYSTYESRPGKAATNEWAEKSQQADRYVKNAPSAYGVRYKSLFGLPWRYAIRCVDELELILRAEVIWSKPNGLPESVTDRVRRSHEQWFHFTTAQTYYSAIDEIRTPYDGDRDLSRRIKHPGTGKHQQRAAWNGENPLGRVPGSVWEISSEPLRVPAELGVDHFAAFPTEWPKRLIRGWAPRGICTVCGEGRRPLAEVVADGGPVARSRRHIPGMRDPAGVGRRDVVRRITGHACACPDDTAPTTPAVVLDPFGGTGTTAMVAKALGCHGISVDMSADYCRLAQWRTNDRDQLAKVLGVAKAEQQPTTQRTLFDELAP